MGHWWCDSLRPDTLLSEPLSLAHPFPAISGRGSLCLRPRKGLCHFNSHLMDAGPEDWKAVVTPSEWLLT